MQNPVNPGIEQKSKPRLRGKGAKQTQQTRLDSDVARLTRDSVGGVDIALSVCTSKSGYAELEEVTVTRIVAVTWFPFPHWFESSGSGPIS